MCNPRLHHKGLCHCKEKEQLNKLMHEWGIEERSDGFYIKIYHYVYFREYGPFMSAEYAIQARKDIEGKSFVTVDKYLKHLMDMERNGTMPKNKGLIENPIIVRCIAPEVIRDESLRELESLEFADIDDALNVLDSFYRNHPAYDDYEFELINMVGLGTFSVRKQGEYVPYE